ncbi:MAG: 5'-nucleotidase C-terminal domain-containing protein [Myxococcaceae bacterium]|nr:5'-nucleotidase C-terminal domain-containing protein [Myxococcaceae bacterium]
MSCVRLPVLSAAAFALTLGCVAYNDPCGGLTQTPEEVVGSLVGQIFLDKANARAANNRFGQLAAEAFLDAYADTTAPAQFAFMNGGAIRNEGGTMGPDGECLTRNVLGRPANPGGEGESSDLAVPVTNGDVHQILLFRNQVYAVDLTEAELFEVMEHSVSGLSTETVTSPSGRFLHVAGGTVTVDCALPAGSRVLEIKVGGRTLQRNGTGMVRVAMPEYLLRGGDGYTVIDAARQLPERNLIQAQRSGGIDNDIAAAYWKEHYGETPVVSHDAADRAACASADGAGCQAPIQLRHCAVPPLPE